MNPGRIKTIGAIASLLALFCMLGGHWFALQSVAWARMLADFSRTGPLAEAVSKTFDGDHPCQMCTAVSKGRQEEERESRNIPWVKPDKSPLLFCELRSAETLMPPTHGDDAVGFVPRLHSDFIETPPSPPPRGFTVIL